MTKSAAAAGILSGYLVAELATDVAGQYCGKLLADGGAQVVKLEAPGGDPLRHWRASAEAVSESDSETEATDDGANSNSSSNPSPFFQYLNTSKKSVACADLSERPASRLLANADIIIEDRLALPEIYNLLSARPDAVITSISPFGRHSSAADQPASELTLQARAGGVGKRGRLESPPVQAGGRIGQWMAGVSAAVGALAAATRAKATGRGEHVDVSIFEGLTISTNIYSFLLASLSGAWDMPLPYRNLELPSIEPTADGYVGFCTMAQQQFQDFLAMIGAADWIADPEMANPAQRWANRDAFYRKVHEWTRARTTQEIVETASALRIPVAVIGNGATVPQLETFEGRGMFVANPGGGFVQPRRPYQIEGVEFADFEAAPEVGQTDEAALEEMLEAHFEVKQATRLAAASQPKPPHDLPLKGVRIVECTGWWAGPIAGQTLAMLGADVIKVESIQRPDGMRFASVKPPTDDQWWEWGMVYHGVNTNKRAITLNLSDPQGKAALERLLRTADVLIENYTPRVMDNFGLTAAALARINPRLITVRMPGFGLSGPWRDNTGFAQTMEQMSGLAWLTGYPDQPPQIPRGPCDPISGLHASFAILVALERRRQREAQTEKEKTEETEETDDADRSGMLVEVAMIEAAVNIAAEAVVEYSATGRLLERTGNFTLGLAPQGVFECREDETWVAVSITTDEQWKVLAGILDEANAASESHSPNRASLAQDSDLDAWQGRWRRQDELAAAIAGWTRTQSAAAAAEQLQQAAIPAAEVVTDRAVGRDQLLWDRGFFVEVEHPIAGTHGYPAPAFTYASNPAPWVNRHPPMLGEHNQEVLTELGMSPDEIDQLRETKVIGDRPLFT